MSSKGRRLACSPAPRREDPDPTLKTKAFITPPSPTLSMFSVVVIMVLEVSSAAFEDFLIRGTWFEFKHMGDRPNMAHTWVFLLKKAVSAANVGQKLPIPVKRKLLNGLMCSWNETKRHKPPATINNCDVVATGTERCPELMCRSGTEAEGSF